jgi:hypothetical protein
MHQPGVSFRPKVVIPAKAGIQDGMVDASFRRKPESRIRDPLLSLDSGLRRSDDRLHPVLAFATRQLIRDNALARILHQDFVVCA